MKTQLIINPAAGHGRAKRLIPSVLDLLHQRIGPFETRFTTGPKDAIRFAQRAVQEGTERLLVLGGDGSAFEAVNGVISVTGEEKLSQIKLGFLPVGTGNSFLRDFGVLSPAQAVERIVQGNTRRVDLLRFRAQGTEQLYALNLLGVGFIADVCEITNRRLKLFGASGYIVGTFATLATLKSPPLTLWLDGEERTLPACLLALCNSRCTGGAMQIAPNAQVDDGMIDVMIAKDFGRLELAALFPKIFSGTHITHPKVEILRSKSVKVESEIPRVLMPDGEVIGATPLTCEVVSKVLSLLV